MKKLYIMFFICILVFANSIFGQVAINTDGSNANASAMFDVKSTNMGLLPPRVADTNAVSTPAEGLLVYDLSSHCMRYYNGTKWSECMGLDMWSCGDVLADNRNAKIYTTVQIGTQCWMAENLNIGGMIDGSSDQTDNGLIEKYCCNNDPANCVISGGLYQWSEMMQYTTTPGVQGICPTGWHLPTDAEWCILEQEVDPTITCSSTGWRGVDGGGKLKEAGTTHWSLPNTGATNSSGFIALPGGKRLTSGAFVTLSYSCYFWSSTESSTDFAWYRRLDYNEERVYRSNNYSGYGFSVRCLQD